MVDTPRMKTTVSIPDDLSAQVDRLARRSRRSRSDVYLAALREYLARHEWDDVTAVLDRIVADVGASSESSFVDAAARWTLADTDW